MKKTKKSFKSSICGGYKGVLVIQKTNLSRRKASVSNMAAARAILNGRTRESSQLARDRQYEAIFVAHQLVFG